MLRLAGVAANSIVDGPGLRFVLFTQGCPHHCPGCHNPETWPFEGGFEVGCEQLLAAIRQDPLVRGVTFSGGEPFAQAGELACLAAALRAAGYEVASYTGYSFEQLLQSENADQLALLQNLDVLIDGPFLQAEKSLEIAFRGSRNQRILAVPQSLAQQRPVRVTAARWLPGEEPEPV